MPLLRDASATVRLFTGQQFTVGTSTTRLRPNRDGIVVLAQRPVTAVSAVETIDGAALPYLWDGLERVEVWWALPVINGPVPKQVPPVDVTYTHGYAEIPDAIVGVVCQVVARGLGLPPDETGLTQESIAGYSYTVGGAAAAGPFGLLSAEKDILEPFARRGGTAQVSR